MEKPETTEDTTNKMNEENDINNNVEETTNKLDNNDENKENKITIKKEVENNEIKENGEIKTKLNNNKINNTKNNENNNNNNKEEEEDNVENKKEEDNNNNNNDDLDVGMINISLKTKVINDDNEKKDDNEENVRDRSERQRESLINISRISVRDLNMDELSEANRAIKAVSRIESKRKRKSITKKKSLGQEIGEQHSQYALSYGMMLGIRVAAGRMAQEDLNNLDTTENHDLDDEEFERVDKLVFPPNGTQLTPPHKLNHQFKFKDYSPRVFRDIRRRFGIDEADYMLSLCGDFNYIEFIANSKSGQFFFYSHDGKYMIKTQTKEESILVRKMLKPYYEHIVKYPNTFITQYYGMHRVKMKHIRRKMYFVIMHSVFDTPKPPHRIYDLKGSTIGRRTKSNDGVMKDLNFIENNDKLQLGELRSEFLEQLEADTRFLRSHNIMDYSLLVGIHDLSMSVPGKRHQSVHLTDEEQNRLSEMIAEAEQKKEDKKTLDRGVVHNNLLPIWNKDYGGVRGMRGDGQETNLIYYMGIIDILQEYNAKKKAENFFKGFKYDRRQISAVDSSAYAARFVDFMRENSTGIESEF